MNSLNPTPRFLKVQAFIRYWEDAYVNDVKDDEGKIPCRSGQIWAPLIDITSGKITNWTEGVEAVVKYKVVDNGSYFLLDDEGEVIASRINDYVPKALECSEPGWGDYICLNISEGGQILNWRTEIDMNEWQ